MSCIFQAFRYPTQRGYAQALAFALTSFRLFADMSHEGQQLPPQGAPPTALPRVSRNLTLPPAATIELAGPAQWFIGQPTDEEQFYLELINRSRRDPTAEGRRLRDTTDPALLSAYQSFLVNTNLMAQEFAAIPPAPPLSMSGPLTTAARGHSQWMFDHNVQQHDEGNLSPGDRLTAQSYPWQTYGENIFWRATSVAQGHAALNVDWGSGPGGMQPGRGHRVNIHHPGFYEIGIGVLNATHGTPNSAGPQILTEDFATAQGAKPFITGVAYYDFDHDGFYGIGEGIGGVTVQVSGANHFAITSESGGYSVPVPGNGNYSVTFTAGGLNPVQVNTTISSAKSVKLDFVPTFQPPSISGPTATFVSRRSTYSFTPVGAATSYEWKRSRIVPLSTTEGAESGMADLRVVSSPGYPIIVGDVKASGAKAFHLAHPNPPIDQVIQFNRAARPRGTGSQWRFSSRLGWAGNGQVAAAQVSSDGGANWSTLWKRTGTGDRGQTTFENVTVSLAGFAGREILTRFVYVFTGGSFFPQIDSGVGWYLDNISFVETDALTETVVEATPSLSSFELVPDVAGTYALNVSAKAGNRTFPAGPAFTVTAAALPNPTVEIAGIRSPSLRQVVIDFRILQGTAKTLQLEVAGSTAGPWTIDTQATIQTLPAGASYRATTSVNGNLQLFRVRVP